MIPSYFLFVSIFFLLISVLVVFFLGGGGKARDWWGCGAEVCSVVYYIVLMYFLEK